MDKLKLIKTIVVILTFLLVFGSLLLIGNIIRKTRQDNRPISQEISLAQPKGSRIQQMLEKDGLLYVLVKDGGLEDRILLIDSKQNKPISIITLN